MEHQDARRIEVSKEDGTACSEKNFIQNNSIVFRRPMYVSQMARPTDSVYEVPRGVVNDEEYFMSHPERGLALIFSHKNFDVRRHPDGEYQPSVREGTEVDRDALQHMFGTLGFEVRCFNDLTHQEISSELRRAAEQDHDNCDCFAVAVLTHCERGGQLYARDREYHASQLWEPFTPRHCPGLERKPKLFFIQASRGRGQDLGVNISNIVSDAMDEGRVSYANMLISYSAFEVVAGPGENQNASRFVLALRDALVSHGSVRDLVSVLTDVNRIVAQQVRLRTDREQLLHGRVHQPCFISTLMRRVYFR